MIRLINFLLVFLIGLICLVGETPTLSFKVIDAFGVLGHFDNEALFLQFLKQGLSKFFVTCRFLCYG